ncbi:MAG: hypothetical protein JW806_06730 [Sedimentisphaerales bacterium]|nr:hypothetical protein [Sedimentisphaerales bacterium]
MAKTGVKSKSKKLTDRQLKSKAKKLGITPGNMGKTELIRSIQTAEGYAACFQTANGYCPQEDCCFRSDCLK